MTAIAERFDVGQERARLEGMAMEELRQLARTVCGYESRTRSPKTASSHLIRRILWSLRAAARGGPPHPHEGAEPSCLAPFSRRAADPHGLNPPGTLTRPSGPL